MRNFHDCDDFKVNTNTDYGKVREAVREWAFNVPGAMLAVSPRLERAWAGFSKAERRELVRAVPTTDKYTDYEQYAKRVVAKIIEHEAKIKK